MENAADASKMAVAALILVGALSLAIFGFTKAGQAATAIFNREKIEYYSTDNITISEERIVGIETVIPTLYSYFQEGYTILFYKGKLSDDNSLSNITPLTLYYTEAEPALLPKSKL